MSRFLPPLLLGAALGALLLWFLLSRTLVLALAGRDSPGPEPPAGEVWTLETKDGLTLRAYAQRAGENWALLLHSRDGSAAQMEDLAEEYRARGWSTLTPDLRGCGQSGGSFRGLGLGDKEDVLAWLARIREEAQGARIVLHGLGFGANAALCAAGARPESLAAVVADSVLADLWALGERELKTRLRGRHLLLEWGLSALTQVCTGHDWPTLSLRRQTAGIRVPILFLHGEEDDLVPAETTESLLRCAPRGSRLLLLPCGRGKGLPREREAYLEAVFGFLTDCS